MKCIRCGGSVIREPGIDDDDVVEKCLSCGKIQPWRDPTATPAFDWRTAALAELRGIIRQITDAEDLRRKARELRAGLLALGVAGVPDLPRSTATKPVSGSLLTGRFTADEDARILALAAEDKHPAEIARIINRKAVSVQSRLVALRVKGVAS